MSSKKKKRRNDFLKRKAKKDEELFKTNELNRAIKSGTMEEVAKAMGIKLK